MWVLWSGVFAAKGRWWDFIYLVTTVGVLPELCSPSIRQIKLPFEVRRCHYYPPKSIAHIQYSWPKGTNPVFSGSLGQRRAWEGITQQQTSDLFCKLLFADLCPRYIPQSQAQTAPGYLHFQGPEGSLQWFPLGHFHMSICHLVGKLRKPGAQNSLLPLPEKSM